jgi:aspartate racemase
VGGDFVKCIGLFGGLSWVSTAAYYRRINELTQTRLGGVHSARILLASVDRQPYVDAVIDRGDEQAAFEIVRDACLSVQKGGADFLVISCNDVHRFALDLQASLDIPLLHIADAAADEMDRLGCSEPVLMGVRKTMEERFYRDRLNARGIHARLPDEAARRFIHDSIYEELTRDVFRQETREGYLSIIERMAKEGADGAVLACTEIPLLLAHTAASVPIFDTTELHCAAAVREALGA